MEEKGFGHYTLLFGIQDAAYMNENMVIAAENLGLWGENP